jgi:hypothetical protein
MILAFFILALIASGITAIPLPWELDLLNRWFGPDSTIGQWLPDLARWIAFVRQGVLETDARFPFIRYGTDWLAFAHIVIGIAFIGPFLNPVKNIWVIEFGMIACVLIVPTALLFGPLRGIPPFWRMIDCSFGIFGILPLWLAHRWTRQLEEMESKAIAR